MNSVTHCEDSSQFIEELQLFFNNCLIYRQTHPEDFQRLLDQTLKGYTAIRYLLASGKRVYITNNGKGKYHVGSTLLSYEDIVKLYEGIEIDADALSFLLDQERICGTNKLPSLPCMEVQNHCFDISYKVAEILSSKTLFQVLGSILYDISRSSEHDLAFTSIPSFIFDTGAKTFASNVTVVQKGTAIHILTTENPLLQGRIINSLDPIHNRVECSITLGDFKILDSVDYDRYEMIRYEYVEAFKSLF